MADLVDDQAFSLLASKQMDILLDHKDTELLLLYLWKVDRRGYVYRSASRGRVLLHREILKYELAHAGAKAVVDHINGDKLDNRRCNLRIVTQRENVLNMHVLRSDNRSGVTGVSWFKGAWVAFYGHQYLGRFKTIEDAAAARAAVAQPRPAGSE